MNKEYNLTLVTGPAVEPLELTEVKSYLRLDDITDTDDDGYISGLIILARQFCENIQKRAYITQTWELALQEFPMDNTDMMNDYIESNAIEIPKGKLQKINSITYKDIYGNVATMVENIDYIVGTRGILGKVCPPYARVFPLCPLWPLDPIIINFTCGYGDDGLKVPVVVKQGMYMLTSHWYEKRVVINDLRGVTPDEISFAVTSLLAMNKIAKM